MLLVSALKPVAVLSVPVVLLNSAEAPVAVLKLPVVLLTSALSPRTVLLFVKQPSWQTARAVGESSNDNASVKAMRTKPRRHSRRFIGFLMYEVFIFIKQPFRSPRLVNCAIAGPNEGEKLSGEAPSPGCRPRFI